MFYVYGQILHMPPEEVPVKLAWTFFIDTLLILAIAAFRWRKSWYPGFKARVKQVLGRDGVEGEASFATGQAHPAE